MLGRLARRRYEKKKIRERRKGGTGGGRTRMVYVMNVVAAYIHTLIIGPLSLPPLSHPGNHSILLPLISVIPFI